MKTDIIRTDKIPPEKLKMPAEKPLVSATNTDFNEEIPKALFVSIKKMQYIVTMFESPSFTPGGSVGSGGIIFSIKLKTIARHKSIALPVSFFVFSLFPFFR